MGSDRALVWSDLHPLPVSALQEAFCRSLREFSHHTALLGRVLCSPTTSSKLEPVSWRVLSASRDAEPLPCTKQNCSGSCCNPSAACGMTPAGLEVVCFALEAPVGSPRHWLLQEHPQSTSSASPTPSWFSPFVSSP